MSTKTFDHLTLEELKISIENSLRGYRFIVENETDRETLSDAAQDWFQVHDMLAWGYGYFGDLDLHMDDYEKAVRENVLTMTSVDEFIHLMDDITNKLKEYEESINQKERDGWFVVRA